jgi:MFS family permease
LTHKGINAPMDLTRIVSDAAETPASAMPGASVWSPLRQRLFRALWIASVCSNIGTWMHEAGAGWLMTSLTPSPVMVALMQTVMSLPVFLLALLAGALADVVDRRQMLLFTQAWMLVVATLLSILTFFGLTTPLVLLSLTLALGAGAAMNAPAWQATAPELVPRADLPAAVTLTGLALNLGRALGPAFGGIVVALAGAWAAFLLNAVSFLGVILVLYGWRRRPQSSPGPRERVPSAIRAGIRYARHAPALRAVLIRTGLVVPFASALWALLPVLVRHEMGLDSIGYGILFGCLGTGAVAGAVLLPELRSRYSTDSLVAGATITFAIVTAGSAGVRHFGSLSVMMIAGGVSWIALMASFNVATQTAVPAWVRARALAVYLLIFQFSMAAGSFVWGTVAEYAGVSAAFLYAAIGLTAGLAVIGRYRLNGSEQLDLTPSAHWPEPAMPIEPRPDDGPVLVMVEYRVDPKHARGFTSAMKPVRQQRLRDGAFRASLYADPADPHRYIETFVVESWAEHLRQHERLTVSDRIT